MEMRNESTPDGRPVEPLSPDDLEMVTTPCSSVTCPTVYRTSRATIVVQGYAVGQRDVGIETAPDEQLVEIPENVLLEAAARVQERRTRG